MITTREQVEQICLDTMHEQMLDYELVKEELRQINTGERVVLPKDQEHAEAMFKVASLYLGYWKPGQEFKFK